MSNILNGLPNGNQSSFFGIKVSKPGINVNSAGDNQLIMSDNFSTKTFYGTTGAVMTEGLIPGTQNQFGLQLLNSNGKTIANYGQQKDSTVSLKFFDTNGIGLAQFGQFPDGSVALKIATPGVEVSTATNNQLIFNSNQDTLKVVATGTGSTPTAPLTGNLTANAGTFSQVTTQNTYSHNLGYAPIVLGYLYNGVSYVALPLSRTVLPDFNNSAVAWVNWEISADSTNVYIKTTLILGAVGGTGSLAAGSQAVKYFLLQETVAS